MQAALVYIIITLSVAYAVWRIYALVQAKYDPCANCQGCALKDVRRKNGENRRCKEKNSTKNLAK